MTSKTFTSTKHKHNFTWYLGRYVSYYENISYNKALQTLGFLFRNTKDFTNIIEYGSILWNPYQAVGINKLEWVQNKFLRFNDSKLPNRVSITDHNHQPLRQYFNINFLVSK